MTWRIGVQLQRSVHPAGAVLLLVMVLLPPAASAADVPRSLVDYTHQRWVEANEAPAPVVDMAQGHDGFLWLATGEGLFRFDGISFESIEPEGGNEKGGHPSALLVTRDGDVWTSFTGSRRFAVYRDGALRFLDAAPAPAWITALAEAPNGAIWALTAKFDAALLRFENGAWRLFDSARGLPRDDALSLLVAADGAVWVSLSNSVARLAPGARQFATVLETPHANGRLSQDPAGRVWLSGKGGSYPLTGPAGRGPPPALRFAYATDAAQIRGAPMFDRAGNLWIATRYDGVQRVARASPSGPRSPADASSSVETFVAGDGLSSEVTNKVLEDREGNVWIGTERGLDKLRPATLRFVPALTAPAAFGDKLMAASDGSVYIGEARTIYRVPPGGAPVPILRDVSEPQGICEAPDGALWIAFATHILVWQGGHVRETIERPASGSTHDIVWDCAFDADGNYWISAGGGGLHRYREGRWEAMFGPPDEKTFYPMTLVTDPRGRLIVQWERRRLAWIDYPQPRFVPLDFGAGDPTEVTIYAPPGGDVFTAGTFGLTRFRDGKAETIWNPQEPNVRISGMVRMPDGDMWLAYPRKLVRVRSQDLERAFSDHVPPSPALSLDAGDGLASRPHSHTQRAMVRGGDGRLWVATETGTLWMDPERIVRNELPPDIAIRSVTADGRLYRDPGSLTLPAATANIEIDYAALSFANPRQVGVRYRLEGFDSTWRDPGTRRQAFYTSLPPGKYRFRVIAANDDGVWNRSGAAVAFEIPPTFVQSRGFIALCIALGLLLLWSSYRLRLAHMASRIRIRLEARLGERERIARDLHDTLLQGIQGLIWRFQAAADHIPTEDPVRQMLEQSLDRADQLLGESRDKVQDLRPVTAGSGELGQALATEGRYLSNLHPARLKVSVQGASRDLHPIVREEGYLVSREALCNAFQHAGAGAIEVEVTYGETALQVRIRDDGRGISDDVLDAGERPGHFGLTGMRERAKRLGAQLDVWSRPGAGTEVDLRIPANVAYSRPTSGPRGIRTWLGAFGFPQEHR